MSQAEVYFIVVSWNNQSILAECLESIAHQSVRSHHTILVDNASADGTVDFVTENYPWVEMMAQTSNTGFAVGNNIGITRALENSACKYIVLLNSDARLDPSWLEHLLGFAETHPDGACIQGLTLDYYDHDVIDSRWTLINRNGSAIQAGYREPLSKLDVHEAKVFGVNAAAALYSRKFLEEQPFQGHFFDDDLFMYLEDVDLCARAIVMGWNNYFTDTALAYHIGSASSSKRPWFSLYLIYRNNALILFKNMPWRLLKRMVKGAIRSDLATLRHHRSRREYRLMWAIMRGRLASLLLLPSYITKRQTMRRVAKRDAAAIWELM